MIVQVKFPAGKSQSRSTQNEQATQDWDLSPRKSCIKHGPVLLVKGIYHWIRATFWLFRGNRNKNYRIVFLTGGIKVKLQSLKS